MKEFITYEQVTTKSHANTLASTSGQCRCVSGSPKNAEINGRIDNADQRETHCLERNSALTPGHSETVKDVLEARQDGDSTLVGGAVDVLSSSSSWAPDGGGGGGRAIVTTSGCCGLAGV